MTIHASPHQVWPWLAQMGQGRGGLYSYDFLENLIGCDIHSADHIVTAWQHVKPGDPFRLHPDVALDVVVVEPDRTLVVRGGVRSASIIVPPVMAISSVMTRRMLQGIRHRAEAYEEGA